jgi:hypothetical protein
MGNKGSRAAGVAGNASSSGSGVGGAGAAPAPEFRVYITLPGGAAQVPATLRLEPEVLLLLDPETQSQIYQVYYFRIVCWGYSRATFHWKAYAVDEDGSGGDDGDTPVVTYTVDTGEGPAVERSLMGSVRALMGRMESRGVSAKDFSALLAVLRSLAADGLTDHALSTVKQMALARKFDARQATELVNALGSLSPFEKMEGCCALYPGALLHPASLPTLLLDCFEDPTDRENVCHRLGIVVSADGAIVEAPTASSRGALGRR